MSSPNNSNEGCPASVVPSFQYLTYLNFAQGTTMLLLELGTIAIIGRMLLAHFGITVSSMRARLKQAKMSPPFYFFLYMHLFNCTLCLPYWTYLAWNWVAPGPDGVPATHYNKMLILLLGTPGQTYLAVGPVALFFLQLDRLLSLMLNIHYTQKARRLFYALELACMVAVYAICTAYSLSELPLCDIIREWCLWVECLIETSGCVFQCQPATTTAAWL